jgi:hypothetical protein
MSLHPRPSHKHGLKDDGGAWLSNDLEKNEWILRYKET